MNQTYWGVLWRSNNKLDGKSEYLIGNKLIFKTRKEARDWIFKNYRYLKTREDLKKEPFGWKMPIPVKVKIVRV